VSTQLAPSSVDHARRIEELGRIILAYSEVTEKLQQSHEQLQANVAKLQAELSEKNRQLERKNRLAALGEMAAGMAHEIRNPLGGIQLYASMLDKDVADRPASQQLVRKISGGVKRLEALVSQVLQFTREITANIGEMELREAIEQAVDFATPSMTHRNVTCTIDGPAKLLVQADNTLIGQALLNLILNASEAIEGGGSIRVSFGKLEGGQFQLIVHDSGPGIPAGILDKLFNPFFTTKDHGTGLGLAIVHRVVEAHDGSIRVTNPPEGGARFEIRI
jgi:two-component system sensor histidine kinase HydH